MQFDKGQLTSYNAAMKTQAQILPLTTTYRGKMDTTKRQETNIAIETHILDTKITEAIRARQRREDRELEICADGNSTIPIRMSARMKVMEARQTVTNLILLRLIQATETGEDLNLSDYKNALTFNW